MICALDLKLNRPETGFNQIKKVYSTVFQLSVAYSVWINGMLNSQLKDKRKEITEVPLTFVVRLGTLVVKDA